MATGECDNLPSEATLERMLTALGPLLRRRARADAPDPAFVMRLRVYLLEIGTPPSLSAGSGRSSSSNILRT